MFNEILILFTLPSLVAGAPKLTVTQNQGSSSNGSDAGTTAGNGSSSYGADTGTPTGGTGSSSYGSDSQTSAPSGSSSNGGDTGTPVPPSGGTGDSGTGGGGNNTGGGTGGSGSTGGENVAGPSVNVGYGGTDFVTTITTTTLAIAPTTTTVILIPSASTPAMPVTPASTCFLVTGYANYGGNNNSEVVRRIQTFLKIYEKADVNITGVYGKVTQNAVKAFQLKYAKDILTPWGTTKPTGNVHIATLKKMNEIGCNINRPLAPNENALITAFKKSRSENLAQSKKPPQIIAQLPTAATTTPTSTLAVSTPCLAPTSTPTEELILADDSFSPRHSALANIGTAIGYAFEAVRGAITSLFR